MKLYVLDDNGQVVFEFSQSAGGFVLSVPQETKVKVVLLVKAALKHLRGGNK